MKARLVTLAAVSFLMLPLVCGTARAQGTAFTYQGQLASNGINANGNFDFQFGLYTNVSTGSPVGSLETNAAVGVTNGVFTTVLNFSNAFNGTAYWLGIGVRTNGSAGAFTLLIPRQAITPTPYAITASNLTGTLPATQLTGSIPAASISGVFSNSVSFTNTANVFAGNGSGLTGVQGVTSTNLLNAYDQTVQYVASAGIFQNVTFSSTSVDGWLVPLSGEFVAGQSGTYLVQYSAHFYNANSTYVCVGMLRAMLNVTSTPQEIPGSEALVYVPVGYFYPVSRTFLVSMLAGQMLTLQMTGNVAGTGGIYLNSTTEWFSQSNPSATMTIVRVQ